jgi:regulator of RNase E activity RraA
VVDYRCEVEIAAVRVRPGDLVFADIDGVLIVPREREGDIVAAALQKARGEKLVRKEIEAGATASAAFKKYGVL